MTVGSGGLRVDPDTLRQAAGGIEQLGAPLQRFDPRSLTVSAGEAGHPRLANVLRSLDARWGGAVRDAGSECGQIAANLRRSADAVAGTDHGAAQRLGTAENLDVWQARPQPAHLPPDRPGRADDGVRWA